MSYLRAPTAVRAGRALKQTVDSDPKSPAGNLAFDLDVDVATTTDLGVVKIGAGLSVAPDGTLSANGGGAGNCFFTVTLVDEDYTATANDCYIGTVKKDIEIKLPKGVVGKVYIVKNRANGNIKVIASNNQTIDSSTSKTLGTDDSLMVVFDGSKWNVI